MNDIDAATGLPVLEDGLVWRVRTRREWWVEISSGGCPGGYLDTAPVGDYLIEIVRVIEAVTEPRRGWFGKPVEREIVTQYKAIPDYRRFFNDLNDVSIAREARAIVAKRAVDQARDVAEARYLGNYPPNKIERS